MFQFLLTNKVKFIGAAAVIAIIWLYGGFRFKEGYMSATVDLAAQSAAEAAKSSKELERVIDETAKMSDSDVDADLVRLGIMRQPEDR